MSRPMSRSSSVGSICVGGLSRRLRINLNDCEDLIRDGIIDPPGSTNVFNSQFEPSFRRIHQVWPPLGNLAWQLPLLWSSGEWSSFAAEILHFYHPHGQTGQIGHASSVLVHDASLNDFLVTGICLGDWPTSRNLARGSIGVWKDNLSPPSKDQRGVSCISIYFRCFSNVLSIGFMKLFAEAPILGLGQVVDDYLLEAWVWRTFLWH